TAQHAGDLHHPQTSDRRRGKGSSISVQCNERSAETFSRFRASYATKSREVVLCGHCAGSSGHKDWSGQTSVSSLLSPVKEAEPPFRRSCGATTSVCFARHAASSAVTGKQRRSSRTLRQCVPRSPETGSSGLYGPGVFTLATVRVVPLPDERTLRVASPATSKSVARMRTISLKLVTDQPRVLPNETGRELLGSVRLGSHCRWGAEPRPEWRHHALPSPQLTLSLPAPCLWPCQSFPRCSAMRANAPSINVRVSR